MYFGYTRKNRKLREGQAGNRRDIL